MRISIHVPNFTPSGHVTRGATEQYADYCGIAYCGNHFTFGQVLSKFTAALGSLMYTWSSGDYQIVRRDSPLALVPRSDQSFDDDIDFSTRDLPDLSGEFVAEVLQQCISEAVGDIFRLRDNQTQDPQKLLAEFALSMYCRASKQPKIYHITIGEDRDVFPSWFKTECTTLPKHDILVLGKPTWYDQLKQNQGEALANNFSIFSSLAEATEQLVRSVENQNFVGGDLALGYADSKGFSMGAPMVW